ncbi:hypothetical protein UM590_03535 [Staphylococcus aureus]|nr:hypothetical protein UM590_03535 [Staphylococcus aureus]
MKWRKNLAQAKTTAKNNLNNLTSINNAQKRCVKRVALMVQQQ